jgi:hypothetical protein
MIGLLIAVQSYRLYSAVALILVAPLLAFQTFPMLLALISGPRRRAGRRGAYCSPCRWR